jgi:hypothetical protein
MQGEMPGFPFPGRPGGEHDEPLLDMIISRRALPPDAPQEMHDLARMLAALAGPAEPGELAGEAAARAAFVRLASPAGISPAARRPVRHRRSRRQARSRAWLAAAVVTAAAGIGVLAAYAGLLPTPVQQLAHVTVAAPAPHRASPPPSPAAGASLAAAGSHSSPTPPAPQPHDSAAPSAPASPPGTPTLGFTSEPSPTPTLGTASPGCDPGQWQDHKQPEAQASGYPGSSYWWQAAGCATPPAHPTQPAGEPTLPPYLPRS